MDELQFRINNACREALAKWGYEKQTSKVQEECAELIAAIEHWRTKKITADQLAEEVAGVEITVRQLALILGPLMRAARHRQIEKFEGYLEATK